MQDVIDDLKKDGLFYGDKVPCDAADASDNQASDAEESEVVEKKREKK